MTHTKKRILAMLLAVVLMFGTLPFSVSADEISSELPTESTVETQPEASQAEDPAPSDGETLGNSPSENDSITISDSSGDVPVLYAQDPFNTVKSEVEGGTNYMTSVGVTRQAIVRELEQICGRRRPISQRGRLLQQRHRGHELRRFYQLRPSESRPGRGDHHGDHAQNAS